MRRVINQGTREKSRFAAVSLLAKVCSQSHAQDLKINVQILLEYVCAKLKGKSEGMRVCVSVCARKRRRCCHLPAGGQRAQSGLFLYSHPASEMVVAKLSFPTRSTGDTA